MGKLKKEVIDEIRRLGEQGYSIVEIVDRVDAGRDSVRKYLLDSGPSIEVNDTQGIGLSDGTTRRLYDLQGILGASSISDAVERAYLDEVAVTKYRLTLWEKHAPPGRDFSIDSLIEGLTEYVRDLEHDLNVYMDGYSEDQKVIAELRDLGESKFEESFDEGYELGKRDYAIFAKCTYCDRQIPIDPMGATHATISNLLREIGWGHSVCREQFDRS